jgi:quercetin dioxygenase-like cupin family protein
MKVMKTADIEATERESKLFKGRVTAQTVLDQENSNLRASLINFDEGAVNVFHIHEYDQILYVTAGEGIIATEKEEVRITPGDFVVIPAGEKHWHGATPHSAMSHIAISIRGKTVF